MQLTTIASALRAGHPTGNAHCVAHILSVTSFAVILVSLGAGAAPELDTLTAEQIGWPIHRSITRGKKKSSTSVNSFTLFAVKMPQYVSIPQLQGF